MQGIKPFVLILALSTTAIAQAPLEPWQKQPLDAKLLDSLPPQVEIVPSGYKLPGSTSSSIGTDANTRKVIIVGETLPMLIANLYGFPSNRISFPNDLPQGRYDVISNLPEGSLDALKKKIEEHFGLSIQKENRKTNIYVLEIDHADAPNLKKVGVAGNSSLASESSGLKGERMEIRNLAAFLETQTGAPVIDSTGLEGNYNFLLRWEPDFTNRMKPLQEALSAQLGMKLTPKEWPIEFLVVEKSH